MLVQAFFMALQLLTRIPVQIPRFDPGTRPHVAGYAVLFYPVIGAVIGALLMLVQWLLHATLNNEAALLQAGLLLLGWVVLTGALHLDGLADSTDAWLGGFGDRERTLAIMKDPRAGPAGVVALVVVLLIKFAALGALPGLTDWTLLVIPVLARMQVMLLFLTTPYVRPQGMGAAATEYLPRKTAWGGWLVLMVAIAALIESGWVLILGALVTFVVLRAIMQQRIGGTTGDTAGALIEITEAVLLCLIVLSS